MPAKAKKVSASATKKSTAKVVVKAKPRRVVSSSAPSVTASSKPAPKSSGWNTPYLLDPQEKFFRDHPNSKVLLSLFIGVLVFYLVVVWMNRVEIFPQYFPM